MRRSATHFLNTWLLEKDRKPLVVRGARQVGKTWLVRDFAEASGKKLIELNFEKYPVHASFFTSNDVQKILLNLSTLSEEPIDTHNSLLFFDEIQAAPHILSTLRWFAEDLPELAVIAAGSLLEFTLADYLLSMPVGRISYLHLEPLSFEEFLLACRKDNLYEYIKTYEISAEMPEAIHSALMTLFKEYLLVGGLPAAVLSWTLEHSFAKIHQKQNDLLATYRDDFGKYRGRVAVERLEEVMMSTPKMLGRKFIFSQVSKTAQASVVKQVLTLLEKARVCHCVQGVSANGVPLAAEIKEKYFKEIFLDVGLCSAALGLGLDQINAADEITLVNQGGLAEQVVGQLLRTINPPYVEPALYCWHREQAGSSAEIDYVIQHANQVIPIEVKAGSTGGLKSLHLFMGLKSFPVALRINSDYPSKTCVDIKDSIGNTVQYTLLSLPFYLIGQIHRLLATAPASAETKSHRESRRYR